MITDLCNEAFFTGAGQIDQIDILGLQLYGVVFVVGVIELFGRWPDLLCTVQ
jgi:hypothetical protein